MLSIRKAVLSDIPAAAEIYEKAKVRMHTGGNPTQWCEGTPNAQTAERDINNGTLYAVTDETGAVRAVFTYIVGEDPTYKVIEGAWLNDDIYGTLHRVATDGVVKGVMRAAVTWATQRVTNLRVDTHRNNAPMRGALKQLGFTECGIIHVDSETDSERFAYHLCAAPAFFENLTRFTNSGDNKDDNMLRASLLGLGGRNIQAAPGVIVRVKDKSRIGSRIFLGLYSYINGDVTIEDDVLIGPHCSITAGHHKFDPATQAFTARTNSDYDNSIVIGRGSWLASNVTVTAGVKIGRANLICAGAVVTKDTPDYAIMAGVPAVKRGTIDPVTGEYIWS